MSRRRTKSGFDLHENAGTAQNLANGMIMQRIRQCAIGSLLTILDTMFPSIPRDPRNFLKTFTQHTISLYYVSIIAKIDTQASLIPPTKTSKLDNLVYYPHSIHNQRCLHLYILVSN